MNTLARNYKHARSLHVGMTLYHFVKGDNNLPVMSLAGIVENATVLVKGFGIVPTIIRIEFTDGRYLIADGSCSLFTRIC